MLGAVQLVPVGATARSLVEELGEPVFSTFGVDVALGQPLAEPKYAFNKDRNQYHSTAILRRLASLKSKDQLGVVGVTEVDLFLPDTAFVLGEADRESHAAIVSLKRLRPDRFPDIDLLRIRGRVEVVHEVGHLIGLSHCDDLRCVMFFSVSVADTDRKTTVLCNDCSAEYERLLGSR